MQSSENKSKTAEIKALEAKKVKLSRERDQLNKKIKKDKKGKQKEANQNKIAEIESELEKIDEKVKEIKDIEELKNDEAISDAQEQEREILPHPNISIDRLREVISNKDLAASSDDEKASDNEGNESDASLGPLIPHPSIDISKDPEIYDRLHPKVDFVEHPNIRLDRIEKYRKCFENENKLKSAQKSKNLCKKCSKTSLTAFQQQQKPCTPNISQKSCESSKSQNICSSSSTKKPCDSVSAKKSCTSIITQKSLSQIPSHKSCSQSKLINQSPCPSQQQYASKNCINCGSSYVSFKQSLSSIATQTDCNTQQNSQPQYRSCKSSRVNLASGKPSTSFGYCNDDHNREFPARSRSKCSQLSQKYSCSSSLKSFGACQSFDECSTCNRLIFASEPSCASFDVCSRCKQSIEDSSHDNNSQSRDLKVRSVNFSTNNDSKNACDTDDDIQNEEIIQKFDCQSVSKQQSFCGCKSTLKCNTECSDDGSDDCSAVKKPSNCEPPKEPSQLSMMKNMLQERITACNVETPPEEKPTKVNRPFDPTKPRLHKIRRMKADFNDLECPVNPCCISDERREKLELVTRKLVKREGKRQKEIQLRREERLRRLQKDQCGDADECKTDPKCSNTNLSDECIEYSKKYKKMKYEIELQNYLVEKLNRDLQMKMSKNFPDSMLQELRCNLEYEVTKLREMVDFTIFEQCRNKDLKWGSIPVSPLTSNKNSKHISRCNMPKTPSGISNISAFSMLEELKLCQEKERCEQQVELQKNRLKDINGIVKEIQSLECKMTQLRCEHEQLSESLENLEAHETRNVPAYEKLQQLEGIKCKIVQIVSDIKETKEDIDKMHAKLHMINNSAQ